jgi:hypothetical protein
MATGAKKVGGVVGRWNNPLFSNLILPSGKAWFARLFLSAPSKAGFSCMPVPPATP